MRIALVEGDITGLRVDAIVNAANSSLMGGGGVDGAIHGKGGPSIVAECREVRLSRYPDGLPIGHAVATTAGRLPARWVIHTVGPIYQEGRDDAPLLRSCYTSSLAVADEIGAATVAFPLVSAGIFGWPLEDAVRQALIALSTADTSVDAATLVLFGRPTYEIASRVAGDVLRPDRDASQG